MMILDHIRLGVGEIINGILKLRVVNNNRSFYKMIGALSID